MVFSNVPITFPADANIILGQSHFIKTVEDIYEAIVNTNPTIKFGVAFNEASGPCLTRFDGNDPELTQCAVDNLQTLGCGHAFLVVMKGGFPINVLGRIKDVPEVVNIFCATANPVEVVVATTGLGRGVMGVIDGSKPRSVETAEDATVRKEFLRKIGYKR
ncbi:MAG: adenosine-specific kinase [Acidobacteria bacterium]|nr:adenosine-specific kinase [Acidobacteriota bacterium]